MAAGYSTGIVALIELKVALILRPCGLFQGLTRNEMSQRQLFHLHSTTYARRIFCKVGNR